MVNTHRRSGLLLAVPLLIGACSAADTSGGMIEMPEREVSRADPAIAGAAVDDFGFDLLAATSEAASPSANVVVSPLSVALALGLVEPGATGEAVGQFHELLRIDDPEAWRSSMSALEVSLEDRRPGPSGEGKPGELRINVANAAFTRPGTAFEAAYLDTVGSAFGAHIEPLDFSDVDAAVERINGYIADETDGHVTDLVAPDQIDPERTMLALVSALLLQSGWEDQFDAAATVDGPFTRLDGSDVTVPLMHGGGNRSGAGDGWVGASKYLVGDLAFEVVLPDEGRFDEIAARYAEVSDELAASPNPGATLAVPRFETRVQTALTTILPAMGLTAPFVPGSLVGIAGDDDTMISDVLHETWISVDETGIEAAAATVVIGLPGAAPPADEPIPVILDRPFLFRIVDLDSGATLFTGRILDPTA